MTRLDSALSALVVRSVGCLTAELSGSGARRLEIPSRVLGRRFMVPRLPCLPVPSRIGSGPLCKLLAGDGHARCQGLGGVSRAVADSIYQRSGRAAPSGDPARAMPWTVQPLTVFA